MQEFDEKLYEKKNDELESQEGFEYEGDDANEALNASVNERIKEAFENGNIATARSYDDDLEKSKFNTSFELYGYGPGPDDYLDNFSSLSILKVNPRSLTAAEQARLFDAGIRIVPNCVDPNEQFKLNMDKILNNHIPVGIQTEIHKSLDDIGYAAAFVIQYLGLTEVDPDMVKEYCESKADSNRVTTELSKKFNDAFTVNGNYIENAVRKANVYKNEGTSRMMQSFRAFMNQGIVLGKDDFNLEQTLENVNQPQNDIQATRLDNAKYIAGDALAAYAKLKDIHQHRSFGFMVFSCRKYFREYRALSNMETQLHNRLGLSENEIASINVNNTDQFVDNVSRFHLAETDPVSATISFKDNNAYEGRRAKLLKQKWYESESQYVEVNGGPKKGLSEDDLKIANGVLQVRIAYENELNIAANDEYVSLTEKVDSMTRKQKDTFLEKVIENQEKERIQYKIEEEEFYAAQRENDAKEKLAAQTNNAPKTSAEEKEDYSEEPSFFENVKELADKAQQNEYIPVTS